MNVILSHVVLVYNCSVLWHVFYASCGADQEELLHVQQLMGILISLILNTTAGAKRVIFYIFMSVACVFATVMGVFRLDRLTGHTVKWPTVSKAYWE